MRAAVLSYILDVSLDVSVQGCLSVMSLEVLILLDYFLLLVNSSENFAHKLGKLLKKVPKKPWNLLESHQ